jgi:hypothetical protein
MPLKYVERTTWSLLVAIVYRVLFFGCIGLVVVSVWYYGRLKHSSSEIPTAQQPVALMDHGQRYYVSKLDAGTYRHLMKAWWIGAPAVIIVGAALQFVAKIPVFGRLGGQQAVRSGEEADGRGAPPN